MGGDPCRRLPSAGRMNATLSAESTGDGKAFQEEGLLLLVLECCCLVSFLLLSHGHSHRREENLLVLLSTHLCVYSPIPDPGQVLTSLWTAQCSPRVAPLVGGPPPLALLCAHRPASSSQNPEGCLQLAWYWSNPGNFFPIQRPDTVPPTRCKSQPYAGASVPSLFLP